jgi:hypothetical protein
MPSKFQCCKGLPHVQLSLNQSEVQKVFETINFSHIHCAHDVSTSAALVDFYGWLLRQVRPSHLPSEQVATDILSQAPEILRHSKLVTDVDLGEFDLTHIASNKLTVQVDHDPFSSQDTFYSDVPYSVMGSSIQSVDPSMLNQPRRLLRHHQDLQLLRCSPLLRLFASWKTSVNLVHS